MAATPFANASSGLKRLAQFLAQRRRIMAGSAFGKAINTQPQGPATSTVTQAATTDPNTFAGVRAGAASSAGGPRISDVDRGVGPGTKNISVQPGGERIPQGRSGKFTLAPSGPQPNETRDQFITRHFGTDALASGRFDSTSGGQSQPASQPTPTTTPTPIAPPDLSGLGAELGAASIARSRKRNRNQQAALSGAALS